MSYRGTITAILAGMLWSLTASAQWVSFTDETATRLSLQPFADNPGGNPAADAEEKDLAVADLDRDGDDDVIVTRKRPFSNPGARQDILLMNESGILVDRTADLAPGFISTLTDARDIFVGDVNGDAWPDVVIANTFGEQPRLYRNAGEDGNGDWLGLVDESTRFPVIAVPGDVSVLQFCALWGGDVTGNGAMDFYFSNYNPSSPTTDVLFINDGTGNFTNETATRLGALANVAFGTSVEIHDADNDGDQDIVKISTLYDAPPFPIGQFILWNDGNGIFNTVPFQTLASNQPYMFAVGDMDNNGILDMYMEGDQQDHVLLGQSTNPDTSVNYSFETLQSSPRTGGFGGNTKMADLDNDGFLDVGVAPVDVDIQNCGAGDELALLRNDGGGGLTDPWSGTGPQNFHTEAHDFTFLDLNSDGCMDMMQGLCTGWRMFMQTCAAPVVVPLSAVTVSIGTISAGDVSELASSDDSYLRIDAERDASNTRFISNSFIQATSTITSPTHIEFIIEAAANAANVFALYQVRNFATNSWETLRIGPQPIGDTVETLEGLANPPDYVRGDGGIVLRVLTRASAAQLPAGYEFRIDQVEIVATP
jgi:hypothetical protein